ncbi:universal stress protein [Halobacillus kuroshimensis]|uniref:Universal stress protein n=1 Tax=Halobacillus kuroshimensis TaxID=302481 RepID=A0ABS3DRG4_9BACI|nr:MULTISPECIES: universal stress protein [Halobacillus]MBN8233889.1 universal stress protein [Halobacillus kuroshimensis]
MSQKILVPIDGSDFSLRALKHAIEIAKAIDAELLLLNVQYNYNSPNINRFVSKEQVRRYQQENAKEVMDEALNVIENQEVTVHTKIRIGSPDYEIAKEAKESKVYSIVMGSRGLGAIKSKILGSVSFNVLHVASCPVTMVK